MQKQRDLLTNRWRNIREIEHSEFQTQASIVNYIKLMAVCEMVCFAVPNGELRNKRTAAKLKASGVLPGVSDLILIRQAPWSFDRQPQVLCLEIKSRKGRLSEHQERFRDIVGPLGCEYAVAHSMDEAITILEQGRWVKPRSKAA